MPQARISMRKAKDLLRMKWSLGLSHRQIAGALSIGPTTVTNCVQRARLAGLESWEVVGALSNEELEARLYPRPPQGRERPEPDWTEVDQELRKKGVTLSLLWQEYKAEQAVQMIQRWVLAPLRHERFTHVGQLNQAIAPLLTAVNDRPLRVLGISRRELFERVEQTALQALPEAPYEVADWLRYKVGPDYHVEVDRHYYSVPYTLVGKQLEVRLTARVVEFFEGDRRVASHARDFTPGRHTTCAEHMPPAHREHASWTPERIRRWVGRTGPEARRMADEIMASRLHPQQGFRACLGLIRLGKSYGADRLEAACRRALAAGATSYRSVASILKNGLDRQELEPPAEGRTVEHDNVRGAEYYGQEEAPC